MVTTIDRVLRNTDDAVNRRIAHQTGLRIRRYAASPREIDRRLRELDREWDVERVLELNAAVVALSGVVLALTRNRRWLFLSGLVATFLGQHAVQGWCPPIPLLRLLGVRTSREIEIERVALKMLRGDFDGADDMPRGAAHRASRAIAAAH